MKIRGKLLSAVLAVCLCGSSLSVNVLASDVSETYEAGDIQVLSEIPEEETESENDTEDILILSEEEMEALEAEEAEAEESDEIYEEEPAAEAEEEPDEDDEDDDPEKARMAGDIPSDFYGDNGGIQTLSRSLKDVTQPSRYSSGYTIEQGIDVAKWEGDINWSKVKSDGIDFAIIRVAYRGYSKGSISTDPYAEANMKGAYNAGVPFGIYIFSQAITTAEAKEEADYAIKVMEDAGYGNKISLPVVMDFEYYSPDDKAQGRLYDAGLSKSKATEICNAFCSEVKAKGYTPMVYANKSMLSSKLNASDINGEIWVAQYNSSLTYEGDIDYWQYSSSGTISGINAKVDMNYRYISDSAKTTTSNASSSSSSSSKTYTKYKTTTSVNYRSGPGTSYTKKGTLAKGKEIQVEDGYSKSANGYTWKRFNMNSTDYYIASNYISKVTSSSSSSSSTTYTKYKTTTAVNYRSGAGTSYSKKGTLSKGKEIQVEDGYSKSANGYTWKRFKMNSTNYYIASKYISKVSSSSSSSSSTTYTKYKTTTAVNYRSGAGTSYKKKGTLSKGKEIQVEDGYSKSANGYTWKRFKMNSTNYYIASKYISKASSSSSSTSYTSYKTTTRVNYRSGAGTSYKKKGTLAKGKKIQVENGYSKSANGYTWKRFKMNGTNYYIASKYIKKT